MAGLPGYTQLPEAGAAYTRDGTVEALRITGAFLVRGKNFVGHVKDGWLVKGEDGDLFGVEDVVFLDLFTVVP